MPQDEDQHQHQHQHLEVSGLDEWSSLCSSACVPLQVSADEGFLGSIRYRTLGPLSISQLGATPSTVQRTPRLVSADPREAVMFSVLLRGSRLIAHHGRAQDVVAGGAYVMESDQPYGIRFHGRTDVLSLRLPTEHTGLGPRTLRTIAGQSMPPGIAENQVLGRELANTLLGREPLTPAADQDLLVDLLHAVTHRLQYGDRSRPYLSGVALWASARWYIDQHHDERALGIDDVASRFMVSRRHLEQQFARQGTSPAAYLRAVRCAHARRLLVADRSATIDQVARRAGFADVNTFIRTFRRLEGRTPAGWRRQQPSEVLVPIRSGTDPPLLLADLRHWASPASAAAPDVEHLP